MIARVYRSIIWRFYSKINPVKFAKMIGVNFMGGGGTYIWAYNMEYGTLDHNNW